MIFSNESVCLSGMFIKQNACLSYCLHISCLHRNFNIGKQKKDLFIKNKSFFCLSFLNKAYAYRLIQLKVDLHFLQFL